MSDLITNLEDLGPEELKAVSNLINKLAKRKRKEESPVVDAEEPQEDIKPRPVSQKSRGRSSPKNQANQRRNNNKVRRPGGSRGAAARTEPVRLSNENKFLSMRERNSNKQDSEIDKKLWKGRRPTERPDEFHFAEVQCKECLLWYDVNPELVLIDPDTKTYNFTCDNCVPRGN